MVHYRSLINQAQTLHPFVLMSAAFLEKLNLSSVTHPANYPISYKFEKKIILNKYDSVHILILFFFQFFRGSMRQDFDGVDFVMDAIFGASGLLGIGWLASISI